MSNKSNNETKKYDEILKNHLHCWTLVDDCIVTRRCFMTGEYCSQQYNIQKARDELHQKHQISAFVIMGFSDMSDVVYKWRIKPFVESLTKYMRFRTKQHSLYCFADIESVERECVLPTTDWHKVEKINVVRSDCDPASNFVICNRICQQLQIADIVVVDLSSQNPNVLYEFGMAVALNKIILPMCFSESFYHRNVPKTASSNETVMNHIGCYPWRKTLFEHYGIVYHQDTKRTVYIPFEAAVSNGFDDYSYAQFPYTDVLGDSGLSIGQAIYEKLQNQYNHSAVKDNTLIVYTMEGFLNESQAASCMCVFHKNITAKLQEEECFCGDRIGVLVQEQAVFEEDKDAAQTEIPYNIGEIIRIGVNQATYLSEDKKVKPNDMLSFDTMLGSRWLNDNANDIAGNIEYQEQVYRFIKTHIRNRGMIIYPNHPVYVERIKRGLQPNMLSDVDSGSFCLFHVMLRNLRYVNEVVVDISNNALQGLFWLGVAHGSDIHTITVKHEYTKLDEPQSTLHRVQRNVFDVSGLWTAIFHSHNTDGFYHQLALVQAGIERHSRLMLSDVDNVYEKLSEVFTRNRDVVSGIEKLHEEQTQRSREILESFYRNAFWRPILCYNKLRMYVGQVVDRSREDKQEHLRVAQWDFDAVSALTHYLSKHTPIGEYVVIAPTKDSIRQDDRLVNSLYIGNAENFANDSWLKDLADMISKWPKNSCLNEVQRINVLHTYEADCNDCSAEGIKVIRGFAGKDKGEDYKTRHTVTLCFTCPQKDTCFHDTKSMSKHEQLAQLVLWRDEKRDTGGEDGEDKPYHNDKSQPCYFRVALIGSSGPATFGLSALFVDKKHKLYNHTEARDNGSRRGEAQENLLCELQEIVRERFVQVYLSLLQSRLHDEMSAQANGRICYCVSAYLSTCLYKYFLPFITTQDQKQIQNSMHTYINAISAAGLFSFASESEKRQTIEAIEETLEVSLSAFVGIETFYRVTVCHYEVQDEEIKTDNRYAESIVMAKQGDKALRTIAGGDLENCCHDTNSDLPLVYCFFDTRVLKQHHYE